MKAGPDDHYKFDKSSYDASCEQYELLADKELQGLETIILSGYDVSLKVRMGSLVLMYEQAHKSKKETITLDRAVHGISTIILLCDGGYITIEALEWCIQQNITVYLMKWTGELLQVLTPRHPAQSKLVYKQYIASESDVCVTIGRELIRKKTQAQIDALSSCRFLHDGPQVIQSLRQCIPSLDTLSTINDITKLEAGMARTYFSAFVGYPIQFEKRAVKVIPSHWKTISTRTSPLGSGSFGRNAINPYHATLNYAYAILAAQILQEIITVGLDPMVAFLHVYEEYRNSLVYDLIEPFRAVIDRMIFSFFQLTIFHRGDFYQTVDGSCRLNEQLRRFVVASFRIDQTLIAQQVLWLKNMLLS